MRDNIKQTILNYAKIKERIEVPQLILDLGLNTNTARQYLSALVKENKISRSGNGEYIFTDKQTFTYEPTETVIELYNKLKEKLPFTDFCIYDGSIFNTLQHHVSVNHAIYVETNRDAVATVFSQLKDSGLPVYKQPSSGFMYDYINIQEPCIIVKALVTESPVREKQGIIIPSLEKILVDIQKDKDFDYMQGTELSYMFQTAYDLFIVNTSKMLRYAKRRNVYEATQSLIEQSKSYD